MTASTGAPGAPGSARASHGQQLRTLLAADEPCQLMGVHDGLSARIAVAEGFEVLWASGLCMSTALGVRDSDEASWSELLEIVAAMVDAAGAPILVDGDTGHGNFNTARRFSARAERIGAAGVCFEDKVFPKMNSFFGDLHTLAPVPEFCGRIKAAKDAQKDPDFMLVARTEALIAGLSLDEALDRAAAYVAAGADAIFVHSRKSTPVEVAAFMERWDGQVPIVIAPTTYHTVTLQEFARMGISGVIWANHSMRAAFTAMRDVCQQVRAASGVAGVEGQVASLKEIFELLEYSRLQEDEARYTVPAAASAVQR
jgi:phosphoenolpyruvate phosphomutase